MSDINSVSHVVIATAADDKNVVLTGCGLYVRRSGGRKGPRVPTCLWCVAGYDTRYVFDTETRAVVPW